MFPFLELENSIMSTVPDKKRSRIDRFESLTPSEQLLGTLVVLAVLLLALFLRSM